MGGQLLNNREPQCVHTACCICSIILLSGHFVLRLKQYDVFYLVCSTKNINKRLISWATLCIFISIIYLMFAACWDLNLRSGTSKTYSVAYMDKWPACAFRLVHDRWIGQPMSGWRLHSRRPINKKWMRTCTCKLLHRNARNYLGAPAWVSGQDTFYLQLKRGVSEIWLVYDFTLSHLTCYTMHWICVIKVKSE